MCICQASQIAQLVKKPPEMQETPVGFPGAGRSSTEETDHPLQYSWASLVAQTVKNPPAKWETWVQSLSWEHSLEEDMAIHSSILAWRIPMDRGAWWALWGCRESDTTEWLSTVQCICQFPILSLFTLVKAMVFPVVMYECENWTIKKAEHQRIDALNCDVGEESWESLGLQGGPISQS